jgi:hypothetical protein
LAIIAVETVHGVARAVVLTPYVGDLRSRQISVFTGSLLILWIAIATVQWRRAIDISSQLFTGLLWLLLTVGFEVCLGYYVLGLPWQRLVADYDVTRGGFLPVGLAVLVLSPVIAARVHNRRSIARDR